MTEEISSENLSHLHGMLGLPGDLHIPHFSSAVLHQGQFLELQAIGHQKAPKAAQPSSVFR